MFLDKWQTASKPINIPVVKKTRVVVSTPNHNYVVIVDSVSEDLVNGTVLTTPSPDKHFCKGDKIMFHRDNIIKRC